MRMSKRCNSQKGLALLSVLLILTLAVILVMAMFERFQGLVRSSSGLQNREQSWLYALSAEQLAMKALEQDFEDDPAVTHLSQYWATEQNGLSVGNGSLTGQVWDRQSCFNLNALSHPDKTDDNQPTKTHNNLAVFNALLENIGVDAYEAQKITQASRDWVYPDLTPVGPLGADDNNYMSLPVAYLAGNTDMRDKTEWRAVQGVSALLSQRLMPYLCALPEHELRINVNTLSIKQPELLAALFANKLSVDQARDILEQRPSEGWNSVDEFLNQPALNGVDKSNIKESLVVKSYYFELDAEVRIQKTSTRWQSLMVRDKNDQLTVIRRREVSS